MNENLSKAVDENRELHKELWIKATAIFLENFSSYISEIKELQEQGFETKIKFSELYISVFFKDDNGKVIDANSDTFYDVLSEKTQEMMLGISQYSNSFSKNIDRLFYKIYDISGVRTVTFDEEFLNHKLVLEYIAKSQKLLLEKDEELQKGISQLSAQNKVKL